jgi:anti-sigma B factor antagonist
VAAEMEYKTRKLSEEWNYLEPRGSFSYPSVLRIKDELYEFINERTKNLLIDLNNIAYIDSVGIGIIMGLHMRTRELKGKISLICKKGEIFKIIELVGLDKSIEIYSTLDEALKALLPP